MESIFSIIYKTYNPYPPPIPLLYLKIFENTGNICLVLIRNKILRMLPEKETEIRYSLSSQSIHQWGR